MTEREFLSKDERKFLAYLMVDEWSYKRKSGVSIHLKDSKIASFEEANFFRGCFQCKILVRRMQKLTNALVWSEEQT
jgi:hypothetical protein